MPSFVKNPFESLDFGGKRTAVVSLGCSRNTVDSEVFLQAARKRGAIACSLDRAELVLVNTCAFTQEAKEESLRCIQELRGQKRAGEKVLRVIVLGCLAKRYEAELRRDLEDVTILGMTADFKDRRDFEPDALRLTPRHSAYLKISEGCSNRCTFCAIPMIKGTLRSRRVSGIVEEAGFLEGQGVKELNIIGQDITLFGFDRPARRSGLPLVRLLKKLLKETSIPWIRLLYLHPRRVTDELIDLMAKEKRICPYLDIPLQHIHERILKLMGRQMKTKDILRLIARLRLSLPGAALRTTFIAGFPSETDREFRELLDFVREAKLDKVGVFPYSREEGTAAYLLKKQVPDREKARRYDELMRLQREISAQMLKRKVGSVIDVLVDEKTGDGTIFLARTAWDAPEVDGVLTLKSSRKLAPGSMVRCRVTDSYEYDLTGEAL
ncbi:MAG: 30S ribosomal protein S12 methylthiotransferase RimO [Candidatus Omnitrophota bacterium]